MNHPKTTHALEYKGYIGSVEADLESGLLHGTVYGINDVIHYEADTVPQLEIAFRDSVDDYLDLCKESGDPPAKPYSGKFQARVGQELHRKAASVAAAEGLSLNDFVCRAVENEVGTHRVVTRGRRDKTGRSGDGKRQPSWTRKRDRKGDRY